MFLKYFGNLKRRHCRFGELLILVFNSLRSLAVFKQFEGDRKAGSRDTERQSREEPGLAARFRGFAAMCVRVQIV